MLVLICFFWVKLSSFSRPLLCILSPYFILHSSYVLHTAGDLHTQIRLCMQAACLHTFALKTDSGMLFPMIYTTTVFCIFIFNNSAFNFGSQTKKMR